MRCPYCATLQNRVIDSRIARDGRAIRRRRHCEACSERFTTYELVEEALADVEKRTGHTEPFDSEKLLQSLRLASKKRPIPQATLKGFVDRLQGRIASRPRKAITSQEIGDAVLGFLRELDPVAYVRYASVYRSFQTIAEFTRELDSFAAASPLAEPDVSHLDHDEGAGPASPGERTRAPDDAGAEARTGPSREPVADDDAEDDLSSLTGMSRADLAALFGDGGSGP